MSIDNNAQKPLTNQATWARQAIQNFAFAVLLWLGRSGQAIHPYQGSTRLLKKFCVEPTDDSIV